MGEYQIGYADIKAGICCGKGESWRVQKEIKKTNISTKKELVGSEY
jgi:hypothetical protein